MKRLAVAALWGLLTTAAGFAQAPSVTLAATTSFANTGLDTMLLPKFEAATGIRVNLISRGSGQDLGLLSKGLVDLVLVNDAQAIERFAAAGHIETPRRVMANSFVIAGPRPDPAGIEGSDLPAALRLIAFHRTPFISRGDSSGTHEAEKRLWERARVVPQARAGGKFWYREAGVGMLETVQVALRHDAYVLTDRGTWLALPRQDRERLPILAKPADELGNQYHVALANPARHPNVKVDAARALIAWLTSDEGQSAIAAYRLDSEQVFTPNADRGS